MLDRELQSSSVLMVGTHATTRGGIATVVRGYQSAGLFTRMPVHYVVTHMDGSRSKKTLVAAGAYVRVASALDRLQLPLLHVHLSSRASFWRKSVVCEMAMARRRPYLLHVHGSEFIEFYRDESGRAARAYVRRILRRAAMLLALSKQWRERLLEIQPLANIEVLPNAVPIPPVGLSVGASAPKVVFAGRLGPRKGIFVLLDAFARIACSFPDARLVCAGDGDVDEARAYAARFGLAERVSFPGWISAEGMHRELMEAAVFVLPSHAEGLPMALLEAMSFGVPVIATPVGGIPHVVDDDVNGMLVPPGDVTRLATALADILATPDLARRLGAAGRETIARSYSLDMAVERLCALYGRFGVPVTSGR